MIDRPSCSDRIRDAIRLFHWTCHRLLLDIDIPKTQRRTAMEINSQNISALTNATSSHAKLTIPSSTATPKDNLLSYPDCPRISSRHLHVVAYFACFDYTLFSVHLPIVYYPVYFGKLTAHVNQRPWRLEPQPLGSCVSSFRRHKEASFTF
jgi:hypothetical protein